MTKKSLKGDRLLLNILQALRKYVLFCAMSCREDGRAGNERAAAEKGRVQKEGHLVLKLSQVGVVAADDFVDN